MTGHATAPLKSVMNARRRIRPRWKGTPRNPETIAASDRSASGMCPHQPQTVIRSNWQTAARLLEAFMGAPSNLASSSADTHQHRRGFGLFGQEAIGFDFRWPAEDALRHRPRLLPERRKRLGEMLIARRLRGVDLVKQECRGLFRRAVEAIADVR